MSIWRQFLCLIAVAMVSIPAVFADATAVFLAEKEAKEIPMSAARISTGAQFENNVILFVQPESQAMWKTTEAYEGYVYLMVRTGMEGTGLEMVIPQILYELKIDGKIIEMKPMNNPTTQRVMIGKVGVYTGWIRSFEPMKIPKDSTIMLTSWVDWGVACVMSITPIEVPEPLPLVAKAAARPADQVFAGQSEEAEVSDVPDTVLEKAQPVYLSAKDVQENADIKMNKNQLDYIKAGAAATWIVQQPAEGYLYLKVTAGAVEGETKFLKPDIQYEATIDGHAVPMKRAKSNNAPEDKRYKHDQPAGWIRSEQMVKLTPGATVSVKSNQVGTSLYQVAVSPKKIAVE